MYVHSNNSQQSYTINQPPNQMFSAMMHAQNKWTGIAAIIEPTIVQPASFSTFMGVQNITDNVRVIHLQQVLTIDAPSNINPIGYAWSVVYGNNFYTLRVLSGETTNSATFATSFLYLLQLPKDCLVQCLVSTSNRTYEIPYVLRWQSENPAVVATITNGTSSQAVGTNTIFTQQPTIQIVGATITAWSWSVVKANWPSYTASSISISNASTPTPTFAATVPTSELPAYYAVACMITYPNPLNGNPVSNQVISIVHVN